MKTKGFIASLMIAVIAFAVYSVTKSARFTPAEDFPREALVYVQVADLPAFIKVINDSKFKEKYAASKNFDEFKKRHLGLKLAKRWQEFNNASGFPIDLEAVAGLANNQAALAVYDIGKLDFVFIAPVSAQVFAATKFVRNQDKFAEETLKDGTQIYRAAVEADRGRQKQELIFANVKGRFVLATSEKLLVQTLNNISGNKAKNRLIDEPAFKSLSEKIEPHTATVWINQARLNDNYYFKRYWLMSAVKDLKNIRAGIFDFEMQEKNLIERRKLLIAENTETTPLDNAQTRKILAYLPENVPFYQIQKATPEKLETALRNVVFDRSLSSPELTAARPASFSANGDDDYSAGDYNDLSAKFEQNIDEMEEPEKTAEAEKAVNFSALLQAANPQAVLTFTQPAVLPAPKFVEFYRAAVFRFSAPNAFDRTAFEAAIEQSVARQILISSPGTQLKWETKNEQNVAVRELNLPALGWGFSYAVRGNELILTNSSAFLKKILAAKNPVSALNSDLPFSELTVVDLRQKANAYDKVFAELAEKKAANEFFTNTVGSFLDSIDDIKRVEIRRNYAQNILTEELIAETGE